MRLTKFVGGLGTSFRNNMIIFVNVTCLLNKTTTEWTKPLTTANARKQRAGSALRQCSIRRCYTVIKQSTAEPISNISRRNIRNISDFTYLLAFAVKLLQDVTGSMSRDAVM